MPDDSAQARLRELRRCTLLPLILGWAAAIAGLTLGDLAVLAVLPLLGIGTVNYITGWPIGKAGRRDSPGLEEIRQRPWPPHGPGRG